MTALEVAYVVLLLLRLRELRGRRRSALEEVAPVTALEVAYVVLLSGLVAVAVGLVKFFHQ